MQNPIQPSIQLSNAKDYRENYANSVQVRHRSGYYTMPAK